MALPVELCLLVIDEAQYDDLLPRYKWLKSYSLVCRAWKRVLYESKLFWTTVDMTLIKQRRLYIANSGKLPLDLVWDITTLDGWKKDPKFPVFLVRRLERSGRLRSLKIVDHPSILSELEDIDLSSLKELDYERREHGDHGWAYTFPSRLKMCYLTKIRLRYASHLQSTLPWPQYISAR